MWWAPHLAPEEGYVIGQHVFRSPALIAARGPLVLAVVPDLDLVGTRPENPWFMDFDAPARKMWIGLVRTDIPEHVLFRKAPGMTFAPGKVELGFFVAAYVDAGAVKDPWAKASALLWERWGRPLYEKGEPVAGPLRSYVRRTYDWAFGGWGRFVWQEFDLGGRRVGAPQFIVNVSQSPNYPGPWYQREFLSIWNQAWFSSLRSASGLFRYARATIDEGLMAKARLTKELALAAPVTRGLFPAVIGTANDEVVVDGKPLRRPRGWSEARWSNSDRTPVEHGITSDWYHVLDMSGTALVMLRWYDELEKDERLVAYARTYGERLLTLQDADGFFPGWLHPETHAPGPVMNRTPESSLSATFLLKLADVTGEAKYRAAALRAVDAVLAEIVPQGRWLDFETHWSCCGWGRDRYLDRKIERNAMHKQNTLSMFWTSEALLAAWRATGRGLYLEWGRRTLDELSMAQQVWQPPFIHVPALGGFGVMNADGEWNDSRETLFAELFLDYAKETGETAYRERGIAALKAGFVMMYCPENPEGQGHVGEGLPVVRAGRLRLHDGELRPRRADEPRGRGHGRFHDLRLGQRRRGRGRHAHPRPLSRAQIGDTILKGELEAEGQLEAVELEHVLGERIGVADGRRPGQDLHPCLGQAAADLGAGRQSRGQAIVEPGAELEGQAVDEIPLDAVRRRRVGGVADERETDPR